MRGEAVVVGSGKRLADWLESILLSSPYSFRFCQVSRKTSRIASAPFFQSHTQLVILMDDLAEVADWTRAVVQEEKGPVLWAVARLDEEITDHAVKAGAKGVLAPTIDPLAAVCAMKMAIASWQRENLYRKKAHQAEIHLQNRKKIERAKGILMDRFKLPEAEAYERIRREAMNRRKSMVEIAESVLFLENLKEMS